MTRTHLRLARWMTAPISLLLALLVSPALATPPAGPSAGPPRNPQTPPAGVTRDPQVQPAQHADEHPLAPAIAMAKESLAHIDQHYRDYSSLFIKRERADGKLSDYEYVFVKIRHEPFSVYSHFLKPDSMRGQEALYVAGRNNNKLQAHGVGVQAIIGTISLDPNGALAMKGQRYPITRAGFRNLVLRIIEICEEEKNFGECEVKFFKGAKVEDRSCTLVELHHPTRRKEFHYNLARVYVDDEWKIPVRFEGYDWPKKPGEAPVLIEEYTYTRIQFNRNFTDADFDTKNKTYKFE
jgi:hypothetical protein